MYQHDSILEKITVLEVLDHILDKGIVVSGSLVISVANIDLVYLGLQLVLSSVETLLPKTQGRIPDDLSLLPD
ncbi:MAG: gas vesicle protein [Peptococcaceae bacterium]|nr:gas vesicle protein [Peptococcaceae bacterium]